MMAGAYMYFVAALLVLGLLGFKMYLNSAGSRIETHRPAAPITEDDIDAAIRAKRIVHAIQMYGLLYQCDLAEATEAVEARAAELKAAEADSTNPAGSEAMPDDHRET